MHGIESGICKKQCIRIGEADIFRSQYHHTPCYEFRFLTSRNHPRKPIKSGIGVGTAYALYKSGNYIIVHLSVLIVGGRILLKAVSDYPVIDHHSFTRRCRLLKEVYYIKKFTSIATCKSEKSRSLFNLYTMGLQCRIILYGPVKKSL